MQELCPFQQVFFNVRAQSIHSGLSAFAGGLEGFKKGSVKAEGLMVLLTTQTNHQFRHAGITL